MAEAAAPHEPMRVTRLVHAPRATVFSAWCAPEHVIQWFAPEGLTCQDVRIEPEVGGAFALTMSSHAGIALSMMDGAFVEILEPERLVFEAEVCDGAGEPLFQARTMVEFEDALGGTRVHVSQSHVLRDPERAALMTTGAPKGWASTLDNLERHAMGLQSQRAGGEPSASHAPGAVHATFRHERMIDASVDRVWRALTDPAAKAEWFSGPADRWALVERRMDVRPGGDEVLVGRWEGGVVSRFEARYFDVVEPSRIVYAYAMELNGKRISVSLATWDLIPEGSRVRLALTEQGVFLDGYDDAGSREQGSTFLLDALAASVTG